ncbi:myosin-7 [Biomphalaria glabrata]|nr:myosin-7 [Biomphalaria glabrata]
MPTSRMSYVLLLCVLCFIAVSDADLILKTDPTTLSSNLNEKLNICCAITNNSVQQLTKLSYLKLARVNKINNSLYDTLVYWYINESDRVEPAPLFDNQRGLITFKENHVCLIMKNATSDDATSYRCEVHGYDAEHKAFQKKFTKGLVKYMNTSKEIKQNETIIERSVHPGKNTSCSFNGSLSESNADYYKNQSQTFEILSAFITGPKQQSNLMQDARRVSASSRRENKSADQVMSQLLSVTLNEQERPYLECLTAQRLCEDQIMYILGPSNQSFFQQNINLSLPFNTLTRPDVHTCTSNESQHSFFGIIGSELDMRMVCAFNLDKIYVFFLALLSPQEMDIFTYMDKNSIEIILNDLLLCVNQLKATSSEPNVQGKIMSVLDTIKSLLTEISSEILSRPDNHTQSITSISEVKYGNEEHNITMNHTQLFTNYTLIENINWIIELFKSLQSENQNDNMTKQKEQLIAILQFQEDYVLTKQPFHEFLSSLHNKLEQFKGKIMEADNLLLISDMQLQLHRNYSVIKNSIQELNNSLQNILEQHLEQDLKNLSDIIDTISKIENQTMKHNQFQKDLIFKIEYLMAAVENVKLLHENDHFNLSKLLQISMNDFKDYRESSSVEISEIKDRTDNQEKLLDKLNSDCQNFVHDIRNMNVTIRGDISNLSIMLKDLKDDFIKFVKDFDDHRNRSSTEIWKTKDDQERNVTMLNSSVKRVEDDIQIMNSTLNTYFAKLLSQFHVIKDDLINYVKTSEIDDLKNLNKNIQKDVLFINHTLKNTADSLNIKRQKDFDNLNMLFQTANNEINTLKSESSTLKTQIDKLSRMNKELTDENMTLRQLYSQVNSRLDSEIKMLQQNVMKNVRATAHSIFHVSRSYFGRRYYLTKEKQFYCIRAAQNLCSGYGGYLAEVNDWSERNFVNSFLSSNDPCTADSVIMIGGTDEAEEGQWVHISRGTPVVSALWASGQPSGGRNENCQAFEKCSLLHDYNCYLSSPSRKFLCEVPE